MENRPRKQLEETERLFREEVTSGGKLLADMEADSYHRREWEPVLGQIHYSFGLLLAEDTDRLEEAAEQLSQAVRLVPYDERVTLNVSDDGQGFDPETVDLEQRLGLRGMRERAEMVGGTLAVESGVGKGTTVTLEIALSDQHEPSVS